MVAIWIDHTLNPGVTLTHIAVKPLLSAISVLSRLEKNDIIEEIENEAGSVLYQDFDNTWL